MKNKWLKIVVMKIDAISAYMECFAYAKYHKKVFGIEFKPKVKYEDGNLYNSKEDIEKLREYFEKDLTRIERTIKAIKKECRNFGNYCRALDKKEATAKNLEEFFDRFARVYTTFGPPIEIGFVMENKLKPVLEKHNLRFSDIAVPSEISETSKIDMKMAKLNLKSEKAVDRFLKNYGWINMLLFLGKPLDKSWLLKEQGKSHDIVSKIKKDKIEMERKIKHLNKKEKKLIRVFQGVIHIRTYRMEQINKAIYNARPFLHRLAEKLGVKYEELIHMTPPEIIDSFKGNKPNIAVIRKRTSGFYATNITKFIIEPFKTRKDEVKKEVIELSGTVANPGKAVGRVRRLCDGKELGSFEQGEIMVTEMTTPDFVSAMKKSAAIVTDLGGMTSHTAIISREFNIPSIIGTNDATKVFKTGDYVFVDAEQGIVKKLTEDEYREMKELVFEEKKAEHKEEAVIEEDIAEAPKRPDIVLWFKDLFKEDLPIVGGKGANLGEMFERFPIPNGFCITVNAYQQFLNENRLDKKIFPLLSSLDAEDTRKLDSVSKKIENLILKARMSRAVEKEALANYRKMKNFVAVRSSATAEDLPTASFAGQQATFLNVKGEKEFLDAVKKCWASLFTSRAIYYRNTNSFDHEKVLISVVVQEMVDSEKAGVMFTVNPVTKNPEEMIIEGSFGLGEMVVSGQVTPDSYIVNKNSMKLTMKNIGDKKIAMIRKYGKNIIKNLSEKESSKQVLAENEIKELALLGKKIEHHYGKPQDIEWAVYKGKIYILQSRPITTL